MSNRERILLAFDTSISPGSISLWKGGHEIAFTPGGGAASKSENILENISSLLENNQIRINDIDAIAVSLGPGSYTGIRVGIATAQGLVTSIGCESLGVSSLIALAQQSDVGTTCISGIWAGRDEIATQSFIRDRNSVRESNSPRLMSVGSAVELVEKQNINLVLDRRSFEVFQKKHSAFTKTENCICASDNVAGLVGEIANREFTPIPPGNLVPIYAREFSIG